MYRVKVWAVIGLVESIPLETLEKARKILEDWVGQPGCTGGCIEYQLFGKWIVIEEI